MDALDPAPTPAPGDPPLPGALEVEGTRAGAVEDSVRDEAASTPTGEPIVIGEVCPLNPAICKAWIISGLITTTLLSAGAFAAEFFLLRKAGWYPLMTGAATAIIGGVLVVITVSMPRYWYRAWRYSIREHDVVIEHGVLWRVIRSVPRLRIQHVDISRDPLDRLLGLASVTLYTAGSGGEAASIPGVTPERAEVLREELLIRVDAEDTADAAGPEVNPEVNAGIDADVDPDGERRVPPDATEAPLG